ncbi:UvrD-helicase domain-containing protein [Lentisphaerota bacterium WC36G]|nr:UvrD-helicase domain-containing protein [Lentisphaerae bacterium WC36]
MSIEILDGLNTEQRAAVTHTEGALLVLAGAGSGKTRVITYRIGYMIAKGIKPKNILAVTFTNKAAREMKERLIELVGASEGNKVTVGTFHSFCSLILRREIHRIGYLRNFTIADSNDQKGLLRQAAGELNFRKEDVPQDKLMNFISNCKNNLISPEEAIESAELEYSIRFAHVYKRYQQLLLNQNLLDFDDMLFNVYRIWSENPDVLERYREVYQYLLIDEYQDTNVAQFTLIKMLSGERENVCVVGDDDQSIYGWRGAVVENILNFPQNFSNCKEIRLEQNYRSTNNILHAANTVIKNNEMRYDKELWSAKGDGDSIKVFSCEDANKEAEAIADKIIYEIKKGRFQYKDFAVLYRSNQMARIVEQTLRSNSIPCKVVGGQEFFSRKEIKDAAAYLKLLFNSKDDQSFLRIINVPPRGVGDTTVKKIKEFRSNNKSFKNKSFVEILKSSEKLPEIISKRAQNGINDFLKVFDKYQEIFTEAGDVAKKVEAFLDESEFLHGMLKVYKDRNEALLRTEFIYEFIHSIAEFEERNGGKVTLAEFLEKYSLLDEQDRTNNDEKNDNAVTLTTVHASKGLEFPCVFVIGIEEKVFPHERSLMEGSEDEELRLFYVAITRAQLELFLSWSMIRMQRGKKNRQNRSHFLDQLPEQCIETLTAEQLVPVMSEDDQKQAFADIMKMFD